MKANQVLKTLGEGIVFLLMIVFPIFIFTDYSNITATKLTFFLICVLGFGAVFVFCKLMLRKEWKEYLPDLFLFLFLCGGVVSWLRSPYFGEHNGAGFEYNLFGAGRFDGLIFLGLYVLLYLLASRYCRLQVKYIRGFCVIMIVMCAIAVVQLSGINALDFYPPSSYKGHPGQFFTTIGNVDVFAGFMCLTLPLIGVGYVVFRLDRVFSALFLTAHTIGIYVMLSMDADMSLVGLVALVFVMTPILMVNRRYVEKLLEVGVSLAVGFAAAGLVDYRYIQAESRTQTLISFDAMTAIGLVVAMVLLTARFLMHRFPAWDAPWKWVRLGVIGAEVLAVVAVFCYFRFIYEPGDTQGILKDLWELTHGKMTNETGRHRIGIWKHALQMAKRNLWFGTGCGTFGESFREFAIEVGYGRYKDRNLDFAHNEYVHLLCTMGITGLGCYLGYLFSTAWRAFRYMYHNPKILVLGACALGYCVWVFFCFSIVIITPIFWLIMGMLAKEIRKTAKEMAPVVAQEEPTVLVEESAALQETPSAE